MEQKRESFIICKHWLDAINAMPEEYQLELYRALGEYGLTGKIPQDCSPVARGILTAFSKEMDNNIKRYQASIDNGKLGGRPKKTAQSEEKEEEIEENQVNSLKPSETQENLDEPNSKNKNLEKPSETYENLEKPSHNLYDYDNDYVNNHLSVNQKNNNLFFTHVRACKSKKELIDFFKKRYEEYYAYWGVEENLKHFDTVLEYISAYVLQARKTGVTFNKVKYSEEKLVKVLEGLDAEDINKIVYQLRFNPEEIKNERLYILGALINRSVESKKGG